MANIIGQGVQWMIDLVRNKKISGIDMTRGQELINLFKEIPPEILQQPLRTEQQNQLNSPISGRIQELLSPGFDKALSSASANEFNTQTLPSLAERFTSLGVSPESTGAFGQQVAQAHAGSLGDLLKQRESQLGPLLGTAMAPQFENLLQPGRPGFFSTPAGAQLAGSAASTAANALGSAGSALGGAGSALGGAGSAASSALMNLASKYFMGF